MVVDEDEEQGEGGDVEEPTTTRMVRSDLCL